MLASILLWVMLPLARGSDPYDLGSSYYCSTCFTNNQNQNYHCCFYFFKCCGEARRGAKSTTPGPQQHYPPLPTRIAYLTKDHQVAFPCIRNDCGDDDPDCCQHQQESQHRPAFPCIENCGDSSPPELCCEQASTESYLRAAEDIEGYVEADSMAKNDSEEAAFVEGWPLEEDDDEKPFHFALGANVNPSKLDSRYFDTNRKLFIPPSLASGHETLDAAKDGLDSRALGWITKELLKSSDEERK